MFASLTNNDLFFILKTDNIKRLKRKYNLDRLLASIKQENFPPVSQHKVSTSISEAINDAPSYPLYILCAIIAIPVVWPITALIPIIAAIGLFTILLNGFYFISSYKKCNQQMYETEQSILFLSLKVEICHELKNRLGITNTFIQGTDDNDETTDVNKLYKIKLALSAALYTSAVLFVTYFLSVPFLAQTLGALMFVSATTGPIAIAIALFVCMSIGIYFGYKKYQTYLEQECTAQYEQNLSNEIAESLLELNLELRADSRCELSNYPVVVSQQVDKNAQRFAIGKQKVPHLTMFANQRRRIPSDLDNINTKNYNKRSW